MEIFTAEIPLPPSANLIWRRSGAMIHRSARYVKWLEDASIMLRQSNFVRLTTFIEPVSVVITIHGGKGWRMNFDLDNRIKPVVDLLKHNRYVVDDSARYVRAVSAVYVPAVNKTDKARCVVGVRRGIDGPAFNVNAGRG